MRYEYRSWKLSALSIRDLPVYEFETLSQKHFVVEAFNRLVHDIEFFLQALFGLAHTPSSPKDSCSTLNHERWSYLIERGHHFEGRLDGNVHKPDQDYDVVYQAM